MRNVMQTDNKFKKKIKLHYFAKTRNVIKIGLCSSL